MNVSIKILKPLADYLSGQSKIEFFRDAMVSLRLSGNGSLTADDRNFLNEFEGRYAEFSDNLLPECSLQSILRSLVMAQMSVTKPALNDVFLDYSQTTFFPPKTTAEAPVYSSPLHIGSETLQIPAKALETIEFSHS
jgi:hypothetical protein